MTYIADRHSTRVTPFDVYLFSFLVYAVEKGTNKSIPTVTLTVDEARDDFDISSFEVEMVNNYTYDSGTGPTTINVHSKIAHVEAKRSQFAQALTMCLLLFNWALTTGSIYIVVLVVFKRERINDAVLLLPVTIILTIPALRNLYPGSPPFGVFIGKSQSLRSWFEY